MFIDESETRFPLYNEVPMYQTADKRQFRTAQLAEKYAIDQVCEKIDNKLKRVTGGAISTSEVFKIVIALVGTTEDIEELSSIINYWKVD